MMRLVNDGAQRRGKTVAVAFNLSGELDEMKRRHDLVFAEGGTCVMASLNSIGLVLAGSVPAFGANAEVVAWWRGEIAALDDPVARSFARDFQLGTLAQPVPAAFLETVVDESLKVPAHVWQACFAGFMTEDLRGKLGRIDAPVLVVRGGRDTICTEADQLHLATAIRGARLKTYEAAGHAMHWEEPQRFARDLAAFSLGAVAAALPCLETATA